MMDDRSNAAPDSVDLSALDPRADAARTDALIGRIVTDGLEARRARSDGVVVQLNRWWRPVLAAATLVLAVSIPVALESSQRLAGQVGEGVAPMPEPAPDRWGLPASVANLVSGRSPSAVEIVAAFNTQWADAGGRE